jgi:DNA-binding Lrp family transcriptional regulator
MFRPAKKRNDMMDEKDREIIQLLQDKFPLVSEPYKEIGDKIWMDEVSVISRIAKMIQDGAIRHFGPFFDSKKLGYIGCLAAVNVPDDRVEAVAAVINKFDEVTHNYLRDGVPNLWFTVIAQSAERREEIFAEIKKEAQIDEILTFSSKRTFKVRVNL